MHAHRLEAEHHEHPELGVVAVPEEGPGQEHHEQEQRAERLDYPSKAE